MSITLILADEGCTYPVFGKFYLCALVFYLQPCLCEGAGTSAPIVTDDCEVPYRCWALKLGLVMEWVRQFLCLLLSAGIYSWELTLMTQSPRAPYLKTVIMAGRLHHRI